jgi:SagB-type dehydrogenase family enzyme
MKTIETYREFLKGDLWASWGDRETDQQKGLPMPPLQKPYPSDAPLVELVPPERISLGTASLIDVIAQRKSQRKFQPTPLTLEELSFLLWATQGLRGESDRMRTVPSAGARHPFETYLIINRVEGVEPGLYRYLPLDHQLLFLRADPNFPEQVTDACRGQAFCGDSAVVFVWTAIPYRTEWRYDIIAHKMIAIDAGHLCQNLYLACGAIGVGTCGIGAYNHTMMDTLLGVDGEDEFTVYLAPVGKVKTQ